MVIIKFQVKSKTKRAISNKRRLPSLKNRFNSTRNRWKRIKVIHTDKKIPLSIQTQKFLGVYQNDIKLDYTRNTKQAIMGPHVSSIFFPNFGNGWRVKKVTNCRRRFVCAGVLFLVGQPPYFTSIRVRSSNWTMRFGTDFTLFCIFNAESLGLLVASCWCDRIWVLKYVPACYLCYNLIWIPPCDI